MRETGMSRLIVLMIVLLLPLPSFGAEAVKLKYSLSLYADEKGNGMNQPEGVACSEDHLVVADSGNSRLILYSLQGGEPKGGKEIKLPQLIYPIRVRMSSTGDVLVLDERQRKVIRLSHDGAFKQYVEPTGLPTDSMIVPAGFDVDAHDNLYLLDILAGRVIVLDGSGKFQRQIDFPKEYGFFTDVAVDAKGTIFLVDGVTATVYSTAKNAALFSPITGTLKDIMKFPMSVIADNKGSLYLADQHGNGIVVLRQDGAFQSRQLSLGWKEGNVRSPAQICIDKDGALFIADRANSRIEEFVPLK